MFTARATCAKQRFESEVIEALLAVACEPTNRNQAIAAKLIAEARAEAASRALRPGWIQEWMLSSEDLRPVATTAGGSKDAPHVDGLHAAGMDQSVEESFFAEPCGPSDARLDAFVGLSAHQIRDPFAGLKPEDRRLLQMTPVELAEEFIKEKVGFLDHRQGGKRAAKSNVEHTRRQIICAARLLQQSLPPGTPFSLVTAEQVKEFDTLLDQIPLSFGKAPKDHSLDLGLAEVAERTAIRVEEGEISLDDVGLSIPTSNKQFRAAHRLIR
jgi:hypothetical protein